MKLIDIKNLVNARLAGEQLSFTNMLPYLDSAVDDINARLHTNFKVFSGNYIPAQYETGEYLEFPDKYIRTVVCVGAAYKWYIDDEEGISTATSLEQQYRNNLFVMERDYGPLVPEEKKQKNKSGFLEDPNSSENSEAINPDIRYIEIVGPKGDSVADLKLELRGEDQHLIATIIDYAHGSRTVDCGAIKFKEIVSRINTWLPELRGTPKAIGFEIRDF